MPQHKSAKKRVKTSAAARERNRAARSTLRTTIKSLREATSEDKDKAENRMQAVLDRAVKHGLIHRNKAARLKSRFTKS